MPGALVPRLASTQKAHTHAALPPPPLPRSDSSIPYWVAVLVSLAAALGSVLLCELCLAHHSDATDALAAVVHFVVDALSAFFVTGLATSVRVGRGAEAGRLLPWRCCVPACCSPGADPGPTPPPCCRSRRSARRSWAG